jgi:hypothetical protein
MAFALRGMFNRYELQQLYYLELLQGSHDDTVHECCRKEFQEDICAK